MRQRLQKWLRTASSLRFSAYAFLWRRLMFRTTFIAITGSVGKSTATDSLGAILSRHYPTNWVPGGKNHRRALAEVILRTRFHHRFTVVEVGTRAPGALKRASWMIAPDVVIVLRVLGLHSNAFPTLEAMATEKAALLGRLGRRGVAILNADDPRVLAMRNLCRGPVLTFGTSPDNYVSAADVSARWPHCLSFRAFHKQHSALVQTNFVGAHFLHAALGAMATAVHCGVSLEDAAAQFSAIRPVASRMQPMSLPSGAIVLRDEFNGSLVTLEPSLDLLRDADARRRIV